MSDTHPRGAAPETPSGAENPTRFDDSSSGSSYRRVRERMVGTYVFEEEYEQWKQAARSVGRERVGTWVREVVNESLRSGVKHGSSKEDPQLGVLAGELARVGNNVNQLARAANTRGYEADGVAWNELRGEIDQLLAQISELL